MTKVFHDEVANTYLSRMWAVPGITGKDTTPYLLGRIVELTGGESLRTNIALVKNNARLGAQIAVEYAKLR